MQEHNKPLSRYLIRLALLGGFVLVVMGAVEIFLSRGLPAFTDVDAVHALQTEQPPDDEIARDAFFEEWHNRRSALEGGRFILFDKGTFDLALGLLMVSCALLLPKVARTSGRVRLLLEFAVGAAAIIGLVATVGFSAILDFQCDRLNMFADTLAIPVVGALQSLALLLPLAFIIILVAAALLRSGKTNLWPAIATTPHRAIISTVAFLPVCVLPVVATLLARPESASWVFLISGASLILMALSWYQSALTPPNLEEDVSPDAVAQTGN